MGTRGEKSSIGSGIGVIILGYVLKGNHDEGGNWGEGGGGGLRYELRMSEKRRERGRRKGRGGRGRRGRAQLRN